MGKREESYNNWEPSNRQSRPQNQPHSRPLSKKFERPAPQTIESEEDEDNSNPWKAMMSRMQDEKGVFTKEFGEQEEGELNAEDEYKMEIEEEKVRGK